MSKNQPRDGNGKFAKTIKVVDKYGNSAYFTPEELEGFGKKKEEKNPDCEPATKGYVKRLLRLQNSTLGVHDHKQNICAFFSTIGAIFGWISVPLFATGMGTTTYVTSLQWYAPVGPAIAFSLACTLFALDFLSNSDVSTNCNCESTIYRENIKKYEPPCEKKDDCS